MLSCENLTIKCLEFMSAFGATGFWPQRGSDEARFGLVETVDSNRFSDGECIYMTDGNIRVAEPRKFVTGQGTDISHFEADQPRRKRFQYQARPCKSYESTQHEYSEAFVFLCDRDRRNENEDRDEQQGQDGHIGWCEKLAHRLLEITRLHSKLHISRYFFLQKLHQYRLHVIVNIRQSENADLLVLQLFGKSPGQLVFV